MTEYRAKTLFAGWKIGQKNGLMYVGVPNTKGDNIRVYYGSKHMTIRDFKGFVCWGTWQPDKTMQNHGEPYRLAYFLWCPDGEKLPEPQPVPEEAPVEPQPIQEKMFDIKPQY